MYQNGYQKWPQIYKCQQKMTSNMQMYTKSDLKYTNVTKNDPKYRSKEILVQGGRGRGEKSMGGSGGKVIFYLFLIFLIFFSFYKNIARGTTDPGYCLFNLTYLSS